MREYTGGVDCLYRCNPVLSSLTSPGNISICFYFHSTFDVQYECGTVVASTVVAVILPIFSGPLLIGMIIFVISLKPWHFKLHFADTASSLFKPRAVCQCGRTRGVLPHSVNLVCLFCIIYSVQLACNHVYSHIPTLAHNKIKKYRHTTPLYTGCINTRHRDLIFWIENADIRCFCILHVSSYALLTITFFFQSPLQAYVA